MRTHGDGDGPMRGASALRDAVDAAGGRLEMSVWELRASFGISRLTPAGRERIVRELGANGLRIEPSPARLGLDERVTIVGPRPRLRLVPPPADDPVPEPIVHPVLWQRPRVSFWSNRRRAVMTGVGAGLLVILLAALFGWDVGEEEPVAASTRPPLATVRAPAPVSQAVRVDTRGRPDVAAALARVDGALTRDDTGTARRILRSIDADALAADATLAAQARILRNRVRFTQSYLDATALAESGRHRAAREMMLALVPFRDAGVRARLYAVEIAKGLVARAGTEAPVRPDRALALLDEAQDIAPSLSVISEVRAQAGGG